MKIRSLILDRHTNIDKQHPPTVNFEITEILLYYSHYHIVIDDYQNNENDYHALCTIAMTKKILL